MEYKNIDQNSKICAVVKADGYGIGAEHVVNAIDKNVDFYAVACFKEAETLRGLTDKPILILNFVDLSCVDYCVKNQIRISVSSFNELLLLSKLDVDGVIKIHFAINTGMNRIGFSKLDEFEHALKLIKNNADKFEVEGIYTHLYNASDFIDSKKQIRIFMRYIKLLSHYFDTNKIIKHACASLGAVKYKKFRFDMVRLGILLYGDLQTNKINMHSVIQISSKIVLTKEIKKGENVGYGRCFIAPNRMELAVVPLGYADGIFRNYSKKGYVLIKNKQCKILGKICMDMLMVDITNLNAQVGDDVEITGDNLPLSVVAQNCQTIGYEILTNIKQSRFNVKIK